MQIRPLRKRTAQVLGLLIVLVGCIPTGWGLSVLTGAISYHFGHDGPPLMFRVQVLGSVPVGGLMMYWGKQLMSWGLRS